MKTVTKKELVARIAEVANVTKVVSKNVIQSFLDAIIRELADGNRLEFREFGVFETRERAPRRAQNPRTLQRVDVPAKRIVKFKVGRMMRALVSGEDVGPPEPEEDDEDEKPLPSEKPAKPEKDKAEKPKPSRRRRKPGSGGN